MSRSVLHVGRMSRLQASIEIKIIQASKADTSTTQENELAEFVVKELMRTEKEEAESENNSASDKTSELLGSLHKILRIQP